MSIKKTLDKSRKETTRSSKMREVNLENMSFGSSAFTFSGSNTSTLLSLEDKLKTAIKDTLNLINFDRDTSFYNLGKDSLDIVEFTIELREKYGINIPDDKFNEIDTYNKLLNFILNNYN